MNDANNEEDFAALFAASEQTKRLATGQTVEGTIVAIGSEFVLINVGSKGEASLAVNELTNDDGVVEAKVGDRIQATIVSMTSGITLSRRMQRGAATKRQLEDAFHAGLPVEGKVDAEVKGGYTVTIARQRARTLRSISCDRAIQPCISAGSMVFASSSTGKTDGSSSCPAGRSRKKNKRCAPTRFASR